jgi:hypothetical protein
VVPLFLDETIGKHMGSGSRAFVHNVNPIWTKRMGHVHVSKKNDFVKEKFENVAGLTFHSSFYLFKILFLAFLFGFLLFILFLKYFFFSFAPFINNHASWMKERSKYLLRWLCIGIYVY